MRNKLIVVVIVLIFNIACSYHTGYKLLPSYYSPKRVNLKIKNVNISLDPLGMTYYRKISVFNKDSTNYLIGYHNELHALDIFNIDKRKYLKRIVLVKDGPDAIQHVGSLCAINFDSIFLNDFNTLVLLDINGSVKRRFKLNSKSLYKRNNIPYGVLTTTLNFGLKYLKKHNSVLFYYFPADYKNFSRGYLDLPFV
ncbi:DUF4221 family protein, partial [bacterium]|nr:DUF4221 family protein [bacterium]